jgi:hypothetical protein
MGTFIPSYFNYLVTFTETDEQTEYYEYYDNTIDSNFDELSEFLYILPEPSGSNSLCEYKCDALPEPSNVLPEPSNVLPEIENIHTSSDIYKFTVDTEKEFKKKSSILENKKQSKYNIRRKKNTESVRRRRSILRQELIDFYEHVKTVAKINKELFKTANILRIQRHKLLSKFK